MGVKEKLGKIAQIINTSTDSCSQLDETVLKLLIEIDYNKYDYINYYNSKIKLEYQDFVNIWQNFIKKNILEIKEDTIFNLTNNSSLKISLFENELSIQLENLFNIHLNCFDDDLIIFYIKDENKILFMYKSYIPLLKSKDVRLPFWEYLIEHPSLKKKFDDILNDYNVFIIAFSI